LHFDTRALTIAAGAGTAVSVLIRLAWQFAYGAIAPQLINSLAMEVSEAAYQLLLLFGFLANFAERALPEAILGKPGRAKFACLGGGRSWLLT
jgi:hypothetical protein